MAWPGAGAHGAEGGGAGRGVAGRGGAWRRLSARVVELLLEQRHHVAPLPVGARELVVQHAQLRLAHVARARRALRRRRAPHLHWRRLHLHTRHLRPLMMGRPARLRERRLVRRAARIGQRLGHHQLRGAWDATTAVPRAGTFGMHVHVHVLVVVRPRRTLYPLPRRRRRAQGKRGGDLRLSLLGGGLLPVSGRRSSDLLHRGAAAHFRRLRGSVQLLVCPGDSFRSA